MDFSDFSYPEELMEGTEREADEAVVKDPRLLRSVFPKVEALLGKGAYQDALGFIMGREAGGSYRSLVDFLFCELCPEHRAACERFYAEEGDQLKETISDEERRACEHVMLCALAVALAIRNENLVATVSPVRWETFVRCVREIAALAPKRPMPMPQ
jgi:hypothetical protein